MAVVLLPYGSPKSQFSHLARYPLSGLNVLGEPPHGASTVGDLSPADHLVMPVSSRAITASLRQVHCRVSLVLLEPPAIQARYYRVLPWIAPRYHQIFTYAQQLLQRLPNATSLPHGGSSVTPQPQHKIQKTKRVSLIASKKRTTEGHQLRHRIAAWSQASGTGLELYGRGYQPVASIEAALAPFRYSVIIENSRYPGYFTEKLIDCLLCRTVPIYWGDPSVLSQLDAAGIIVCQSEAELRQQIATYSDQDYESRLPAIEENFHRAANFAVPAMHRAARDLAMQAQCSEPTQSISEIPHAFSCGAGSYQTT